MSHTDGRVMSGALQAAAMSIATVSLGGTLREKLSAAASAGFGGVELSADDLAASCLSPREAGRMAADLGVRILLYQPFRDFEAVPGSQVRAALDRAGRAFDVMADLGCGMMLACSNATPGAIDDDALAAAQLAMLADRARACGAAVAYEALSWGTHVSDYWHTWQIVQAAAHPSLGTCLDSFHILARRDDPGLISLIPAEKVFFVQLADAPLVPLDLKERSRHHRCFPGAGSLDVGGFAARVAAAGYSGPWSLEVFNDRLRQASPGATAADGMRSLMTLGACARVPGGPGMAAGA